MPILRGTLRRNIEVKFDLSNDKLAQLIDRKCVIVEGPGWSAEGLISKTSTSSKSIVVDVDEPVRVTFLKE